MYKRADVYFCEFPNQIDDRLEIRLINKSRFLLKRICAISRTMKHGLRLECRHHVSHRCGVVEVHTDYLAVWDLRETVAFLASGTGEYVRSGGQQLPAGDGQRRPR